MRDLIAVPTCRRPLRFRDDEERDLQDGRRPHRAWVVAGSLAVAMLDDYLDTLGTARILRPKDVFVAIDSTVDADVDVLGAIADEVGVPQFALSDGRAVTFAKVY